MVGCVDAMEGGSDENTVGVRCLWKKWESQWSLSLMEDGDTDYPGKTEFHSSSDVYNVCKSLVHCVITLRRRGVSLVWLTASVSSNYWKNNNHNKTSNNTQIQMLFSPECFRMCVSYLNNLFIFCYISTVWFILFGWHILPFMRIFMFVEHRQ